MQSVTPLPTTDIKQSGDPINDSGAQQNSARSSQSPSRYSGQSTVNQSQASGYSLNQNTRVKKLTTETRVKNFIYGILEGKFVTILMTLVTIFALIGVSLCKFIHIGRHQIDCYEQVSGYLLLVCVADFVFPLRDGGLFWEYRLRRLQVLFLLLPRHNCNSFTNK